jgi:hypothetical protein
MTYRIEFSTFDSFEGLEYDHKPTAEDIDNLLDISIDNLTSGYISPDVGIYPEDEEVE